ncbi:hypothetical protein [Piscinibacter koreensis]|uniref:Uncharacterized protein n=1 Tax=Piscinibacter koreensis TaxID=2742824 RepID=A0A7Y6NJC1_9BURK|nr:hypothetical protein [Schlegelella koreensis]NUZ04255.1 hypothetical protein [Schlegelella koreensis]
MRAKLSIVIAAGLLGAAGCASTGADRNAPAAAAKPAAAAPAGDTRVVKSRDGRFEGEIVGTIAPGSRFSKLSIGMEQNEVLSLIGGPDSVNTHETGKRWIPFYYGNDVRRIEVFYKGEGCLTFTGGNPWGGGGNELIRITATTRTDCAE